MVVGGGIGGMQASLDLSAAGYKVYLVERTPAIGGVMAQLDKTFPTNDCAMCTLAPRLVDVGGHLNIETITGAEVEAVTGSAGDFEVTLHQDARYIDLDKCTGCSECVNACPVVVDSEFDVELIKRNAIYRRYPQAVPGAFAVDKQGLSPCRFACPAGVNAHAYVTLIARRRFKEALQVERRENPFPAICGRICPHACEMDCTRGRLDEPIAIAALKRFLADWELAHPQEKPPVPEILEREEKVAVIGGGPAGLTAARDLRLKGYRVTVFEAMPALGGMLRYGIPDYRLPGAILDHEIQTAVLDLGVEIKLNTRMGKDVTIDRLRDQGYKAFLFAIGAPKGMKLNLPGEEETKEGLVDAAAFLQDINLGKDVKIDGKVLVAGGGNAALDAARSAVRLGADDVTLLYRRAREQMPVSPGYLEEAEREGVKIRDLCAPARILQVSGKLRAVECAEMDPGQPDHVGRRLPSPVEGSEFRLDADWLITATSRKPDVSSLTADATRLVSKWGYLQVDGLTLQSRTADIFAAGDAVSGPATSIEAIEAGKQAAVSIDLFLNGQNPGKEREAPGRAVWAEKPTEDLPKQRRLKTRTIPLQDRIGNFREVELGYTEEEAVAEANRCLNCATCCECLLCVDACQAKAIRHDMQETTRKIRVGAVVLAPGYELFDAELSQEFGYGRYPNVVTSLQFERILSASGPYQGKVLRPSDQKTPKKIAFIQCVGSRELSKNNYCSSVCCMYATKQAIIAKEHENDLDCTVFFIDMRAFGKGFDDYYERAREQGIKYVRCRPSMIFEDHQTHKLKITYQGEDNETAAAEFDMVVLSCGLTPSRGVDRLAEQFGIRLNHHGFCHTKRFSPIQSTTPGVYVCGPFTEPKDIPETVMQASGAASKAMGLLREERGTLITHKEYPPEKDVTGQEPRIGVFVCHCGKNIGGVADVPAIVEYVKTLPNVVHAEDNLYTCSADTQLHIQEMIRERDLNRVVVASCTPRTHEPLFRDTCRLGGLNEYLFEMANIRDQNTWVHMHAPDLATEKAKDLVRMAVAKSRLLEPLYRAKVPVNPDALVVGGGMAGMTSAIELADQGFRVHLVEKEKRLGGNLRDIHYLLEGEDPHSNLETTIRQTLDHPGITVHFESKVGKVEGFYGNFESTINGPAGERRVQHGAIVVATGARERKPTEYLYGQSSRVMTQRELEAKLAAATGLTEQHKSKLDIGGLESVVMIQCVGSREPERPWCSRICCSHAVKNALKLKEIRPDLQVYVLYRDIRTYGLREEYYGRAREKGVRFLRYDQDKKPVVENGADRLKVSVFERMLNREIRIDADLVVLSTGIVPNEDNDELGQMMKISLSQEKFFLEAHMKLRPVDFATDGIFMAGMCHWPKTVDESIIQACGAASRAATILSCQEIQLEGTVSHVIDANCDGCAYCVDPCPFDAITLIEYMSDGNVRKTVDVNESLCKGCGNCQATCPKKGIEVGNFKPSQIEAMVEAALEG